MLGRVLQRSRHSILIRSRFAHSDSTSTKETTTQRVYVVFGGYGAIGKELCAQLHEAPETVVIAVGRDKQKLQDVPASDHVLCDATNSKAVEQALNSTKERFGRVDGVANAVGNLLSKSLLTTTDEEIMHTLNVNLVSSLHVVRAAVPVMSSTPDGGSIVLISAAAARFGLPNYDVFAAAKVGDGLTRRIMDNTEARELTEAVHALKRVGTPKDVASALAFLLCDRRAGFVTGQVLGVDGGLASVKASDWQ